jgi:cob(I)alamin adenosyltransferase
MIIVFTGHGKGKTTAAIGMALRGAGHRQRTLMIQFIKGSWRYGELEAARNLEPYFEIVPMGKGFIRHGGKGANTEDRKAVLGAWDFFREQMTSGRYDMIILDEVNNAISYDLLPVEEVLETLKTRPPKLHVVLTGRNADPRIIEVADLVTEMKEIKHPLKKGVKARKGIEY